MNLAATGYEVLDSEGNIDLDTSLNQMREMVAERREKYEDFFEKLKKLDLLFTLTLVPNKKLRLELFDYIYWFGRYFDDIIDGDTPTKLTHEQRKEYYNSSFDGEKENLYDILLSKIDILSNELGIQNEVAKGIQLIVKSISFDLDRIIGPDPYRSENDLKENFHLMDIEGTIELTCLIFGLDPNVGKKLLIDLGNATRIGYTLEDIRDDLKEGIINISQEAMNEYNISENDIRSFINDENVMSIGLRKWIEFQCEKGERLLKNHSGSILNNDIPLTYLGNNLLLRKWYNYLLRTKVLPMYVNETKLSIAKIQQKIT